MYLTNLQARSLGHVRYGNPVSPLGKEKLEAKKHKISEFIRNPDKKEPVE